MAETRKITTLYVVTDSENSYDNIGDIEGGLFDDEWLQDYIAKFGAEKLYKRLAYMNRQIVTEEIFQRQTKDLIQSISEKNKQNG